MNEFLLPKNHIANPSDLADFQCMICYEIDTELVRCKGPCKQIFCLHCATRFKIKSHLCPNRCSNPCLLEPVPNLSIQFNCPFDPLQCKSQLIGTDKFRSHCQECQFVSNDFKQQIQRNKEFMCLKDHKLLFLNEKVFQEIYGNNNFFQTTINEICHLCNSQTVCTSICKECSTPEKKCVFCIKCRFLPCTKTQCPIGHPYAQRNGVGMSTICDFCGLAVSIFGNNSFRDYECNFDICENCHKDLPEAHPLVPLNQTKTKPKLFQWFHNHNHLPNLFNLGAIFNHQNSSSESELSNQQENFHLADHLSSEGSEEMLPMQEPPELEEENNEDYEFDNEEVHEEEEEWYDPNQDMDSSF